MQSETVRPYFLVALLIGAVILVAFIFDPFLKALALAMVFAVVLQGLYKRILKVIGGNSSLASLITVVISAVIILAPLSLMGILVANEAQEVYQSLEEGSGRSTIALVFLQVDETLGGVVPGLGELSRNVSANIDLYTKELLQWITKHSGAIFASVSSLLLSLFVFLIALYYLLRDGKRVREVLIELSPLNNNEDERVYARLELAVTSVIRGNLTIALIQGVLTAIGFWIFGVPNSVLWGMTAGVAALIPGFGTALVFIPAVIFLFFSGATLQAVGLLVWGVVAVGFIDNLLGPKLIGKGMQLHPLLVLLSVLGGIALWGPAGIFLGPLALSFLFALLSIYADSSRKV